MKYLELDEQGNITLDAVGLPISCNFISRARKYPLVIKIFKFLEHQNFHLRGIVPGVILALTWIDVKNFNLDALPRALMFICEADHLKVGR